METLLQYLLLKVIMVVLDKTVHQLMVVVEAVVLLTQAAMAVQVLVEVRVEMVRQMIFTVLVEHTQQVAEDMDTVIQLQAVLVD